MLTPKLIQEKTKRLKWSFPILCPLDQIIYRVIIIALWVTGQTHDPSKKSFVPIHWLRDSQISTFTDGQWSNNSECTNGTFFWNEMTRATHFLNSEFKFDYHLVLLSNLVCSFTKTFWYGIVLICSRYLSVRFSEQGNDDLSFSKF